MVSNKPLTTIKLNKFIELNSGLVLSFILILSLLFATIFSDDLTFKIAIFASLLSSFFSFLIIFFSDRILTIGVTSVLFIYFTIAHFGATTIFYFFPEIIKSSYYPHQYAWLYSNFIPFAMLYCVIGQISFVLSSLFFHRKKSNYGQKQNIHSTWLPRLGLLSIYVTLVYFIYNIISGNISLKLGYYEFIEWRTGAPFFAYAIFLIATGFVLTISSGTRKQIRHSLIIYTIVSVILLLTGNKGEVLYAVLAGVGIYSSKGNKIPKKIFIIGVFLLFVVIPFITSVRQGSIINSLNELSFNIASPFLEIGWQMRVVEKVVSWTSHGEKLGYGISYFVPVQRIVSSLTLGIIPRIPITNVPWAFGERLPGWGFSPIAEAYYNFSLFGPILFYSIQGWFSQLVESEIINDYKHGFYSSIVVMLMILTRNRFSFVPGQILMSLFIVLIGFILDSKYTKKTNNLSL